MNRDELFKIRAASDAKFRGERLRAEAEQDRMMAECKTMEDQLRFGLKQMESLRAALADWELDALTVEQVAAMRGQRG